MIEKEKKSVDKGKTFTVLFTDVSEAFYCLLHDLIIAKLCVYGFNLSAARLMQSYLSNTGFDLSFWSTVVKMYPFEILCWVNKDENM